jgi:hypothetical protein
MCFGGGGDNGAAARAEQERQNQIAKQRQEELNRLAREREALAAQQAAEMRAQQQEQIGGIRARGQAVSQSLRILALQGGKQAPTASAGGRPKVQGAKSTAAGLRMGATGQSQGSGANVAV